MKTITDLTLLFHAVQTQQVFADSKTFCDCIPKIPLATIEALYNELKEKPDFSINQFVQQYFQVPAKEAIIIEADTTKPAKEHIKKLWPYLTRLPNIEKSSILPLPYPYIVPGGRFQEIYYWDSYFTMLGLQVSGQFEMIENMVKNFAHLINTIGYIPNGNRTYYLGRSQPPFFSLMVQLLAEIKGEQIFVDYLTTLQKEYDYWMDGLDKLNDQNTSCKHLIQLDGCVLNRYWDENDTPRPEAYKEDIELAHQSDEENTNTFRHIRAAAESGWDFSTRWLKNATDFASIHTTDIIPVDLNCLLYQFEHILEKTYAIIGNQQKAEHFSNAAMQRKKGILQYCWHENNKMFTDYDWKAKQQKQAITLAAAFPLYVGIANNEQAKNFAAIIETVFLKKGGLVTTLVQSGQQWDYPNGWAPLQWVTVIGLENYGYAELARNIATNWLVLNNNVFARTGKMMEKYNVVDTHLEAGGGEYPGQDGFGWTNGVLLAFTNKYMGV